MSANRYYFDTEFIEDGKTIDLISIGMVSDDGRELYLANRSAKLHLSSDWVQENVLPQLPPYSDSTLWVPHWRIRDVVSEFVTGNNNEFWAYYADYDSRITASSILPLSQYERSRRLGLKNEIRRHS